MRTTIKHIATGAAIAGLFALPVVATAASNSGSGETVVVESYEVQDDGTQAEGLPAEGEAEAGEGDVVQDVDTPDAAETDAVEAEEQGAEGQGSEGQQDSEEPQAAEQILVTVDDMDAYFVLRADAASQALAAIEALEDGAAMELTEFAEFVESDEDGQPLLCAEDGGSIPLPVGVRDVTFRFPEGPRTIQVYFPFKSWARLVPIEVDGVETTSSLNVTRSTASQIEADLAIDSVLSPDQFFQLIDRLAEDFGIVVGLRGEIELSDAIAKPGKHEVEFFDGNRVTVETPGKDLQDAPADPTLAAQPAEASQGLQVAQNVEPADSVEPVEGAEAGAVAEVAEEAVEPALELRTHAVEASDYIAVTALGVIRGSNGWPTTQRPYVVQSGVDAPAAAMAPAQGAVGQQAVEPEAAAKERAVLPETGRGPATAKAEKVVNVMLGVLPKAAVPEQAKAVEQTAEPAPSQESAIASSSSRAALFSVAGAAGVGLVLAGTLIAIRRVR